jgi:hypothetical protein
VLVPVNALFLPDARTQIRMAQAKFKRTTSDKKPTMGKPNGVRAQAPAQILESKITGLLRVKAEHVGAGCDALAAEGDCMVPEICDCDYVVVSPSAAPKVGKITGIIFKDRRLPKIKRLLSLPRPGWFMDPPNSADELPPSQRSDLRPRYQGLAAVAFSWGCDHIRARQ